MADLRPITPAGSNTSALDSEALRYALKAWLREEGFYDVKVRGWPAASYFYAYVCVTIQHVRLSVCPQHQQVSVYSTAPDALATELGHGQPPPPSERATEASSVMHHFKVLRSHTYVSVYLLVMS